MGTWAVDAFGNDYAQDWAEDLHETSNLDAVEDTLNTVLDSGADLEAPFAAEALAAIEVLARLQGKGGPRSEDSASVDEWVEARKAKASSRAPTWRRKPRKPSSASSRPTANCASCGKKASTTPTGAPQSKTCAPVYKRRRHSRAGGIHTARA
jgi:hypothetical protein